MFKKQNSLSPKSRINLYYKLKICNEMTNSSLLWEMSPDGPDFVAGGKVEVGSQGPQ